MLMSLATGSDHWVGQYQHTLPRILALVQRSVRVLFRGDKGGERPGGAVPGGVLCGSLLNFPLLFSKRC